MQVDLASLEWMVLPSSRKLVAGVFSILFPALLAACSSPKAGIPDVFEVRESTVDEAGPGVLTGVVARTLVSEIREPWGLDFLPDGRILVTELSGGLNLIDPDTWQLKPVAGVPRSEQQGQGGMMDVLVYPRFDQDPWVYLSYTVGENGRYSTRVSRARLQGLELVDHQVLFTAEPYFKQRSHFGSRLLIDQGYLYISIGDRGNRDLPQSLETHNGKVIRLLENGEIPRDNPFVGVAGARPEIYTYGHRNPQGVALHPDGGAIWISEHGPRGGDEINILRAGANYGWPVITHGREYSGGAIGEGKQKAGMEQPFLYHAESPGVAGIDFYSAKVYPGCEASLLVSRYHYGP
jgi:glucose/arabinose dehydrogenase